MVDSDRILRDADVVLRRHSDAGRSLSKRGRQLRRAEAVRRVQRIVIADVLIVITAIAIGLVMPLGFMGAMGVLALLVATTILLALLPTAPAPSPDKLGEVALKALPLKTEQWMETQRLALPAPAIRLFDEIGVRLEALSPQLATLDPREPAAAEVRKLIGEQLPDLVKGYQRVPAGLRTVERNGVTPDTQLIEGLKVIEGEIGAMTAQLAEGDLNLLATRERFLQIKYREEGRLE